MLAKEINTTFFIQENSTVLSTPMPDHWGYSLSLLLECAADGVFKTYLSQTV